MFYLFTVIGNLAIRSILCQTNRKRGVAVEKIFASPSRYIQGKGLLKTGIHYIQDLGQNVVLLTDEIVWQIVGEEFEAKLKASGINVFTEIFAGETSKSEIERITQKIKAENVAVLLSLGGGKLMDTGKAIANQLGLALVIIPTTASTDAPTSSISVFYQEDGRFQEYLFYQKNPDLILVDTEVIANAPVRLLISGIADGLATAVEARAVQRKNGENMLGGKLTITALAIAEKCEEVLFNYSLQAIEANKEKVVTEALEAVIEANTLLSGLGFESAGLAAAHAIHNGFSAISGASQRLTHGEKVAFGTLVQLFLENQPKSTIDKYISFYQLLGLPTTLAEVFLNEPSKAELVAVAQQAASKEDRLQQMPMSLSAADLVAGMLAADSYVKKYFQ